MELLSIVILRAMDHRHITEAQRSRKMLRLCMGGVLGIMIVAWLVWASVGYSVATHAMSSHAKDTEKAYGNNDPQVMEANLHFIERARAIEASFKAAFLFHK